MEGEAIGQAIGVLGGTALGLYAFSRLWPNQESVAVPLSLKVYDNGFLSVGARTDGELAIGGKTFDYDFRSAGLTFRENINSGVVSSQSVGFSAPDKLLTYGAALHNGKFTGSVQQGADLDDTKLTGTKIALSQGVALSEKWVGQMGMKQDFDGKWKPIHPAINLGVHYQLNETWGFNAVTGVSSEDYQSNPDYSLTLGAKLYL